MQNGFYRMVSVPVFLVTWSHVRELRERLRPSDAMWEASEKTV